ncbi:KAT8 regulatory NSL complex subunit 1-like protein [Engystomops pustulosus]|uniref:KAT8 regulatory NSL complex subunit 1-like protein n=1 Tax=Engystomops pustulosus TaxID=76066 RepID=UPI003AFA60A2
MSTGDISTADVVDGKLLMFTAQAWGGSWAHSSLSERTAESKGCCWHGPTRQHGVTAYCSHTGEQDSYTQRFSAQHEARPLLNERKVKRELFPGTVSKVLADVNKLWDISVTEDEGVHRLNGRIDGESLAIPLSTNGLPNFGCTSHHSHKLPKTANKETEAKLLHQKCLTRQQELLGRVQRARKHLQFILAKYAVDHCRQQIGGLVKCQTETRDLRNSTIQLDKGADIDPDLVVGQRASVDYKDETATTTAIQSFIVPAASIIHCIQQELDSDVTESSSDEDGNEKPKNTHDRTAEWKWLSERAHVGSRWAWLQAQIAELEYKIHHLVDLRSKLRSKKGTLVFQECSNCILGKESHLPYPGPSLQPAETLATPPEETNLPPAMDLEMSPSSPTLFLRNIEKQSAQLTEMVSSLMTAFPMSLSPSSPDKSLADGKMIARPSQGASHFQKAEAPIRNGVCRREPVKKRKRIRNKTSSTLGSSSARTRPLLVFHKRNLYRMGPGHTPLHVALQSPHSLYGSNELWQASNYSSTGLRGDKPQRPVLVKRNVTEIDPNFHPILSLPSDLPLHLHFEGLLKSKEVLKSRMFIPDDDENPAHVSHGVSIGKKYSKLRAKWRKHCVENIGSQFNQGRRHGNLPEADNHLGIPTQADDLHITPTSQKTSMQLQARDPNIVLSAARRRARSESSYDIDNIVIPMNLIAPSKLEKLQYKEILTPRWKEVALEPFQFPPDEELEDLSDEAFMIRHQKYEQEERVRWAFWEQSKWPKRSRSSSHSSGQCPGNMFLCTEDNCSPDSTSPVSWETPPPSGFVSHNLQPAADFQQGKAEYWERRIFPLIGKAAGTLKDTHTTAKHFPCPPTIHLTPAREHKGEDFLNSSCNKENR